MKNILWFNLSIFKYNIVLFAKLLNNLMNFVHKQYKLGKKKQVDGKY